MLLICYGTRPEIIKIFPLIKSLKEYNIPFKTLFSGQHVDLLKQYKDLIPEPDYFLNIMEPNQSLNSLLAKILIQTDEIFAKKEFNCIFIQGDTTTALGIAISAYHHKIRIGHIEAGLRTYNKYSPFPEEVNRQSISKYSYYHFAPTKIAKDNLLLENINKENIYLYGNTIMDSLKIQCEKLNISNNDNNNNENNNNENNIILITLHRRENKDKMKSILNQINIIAQQYPDLIFLYPFHHSTPIEYKELLTSSNINITSLFSYDKFLKIIHTCRFIISDSGGIQEEVTYFNKKILICRDTTERPETIKYGYGKLVDDDILNNFEWIYNETKRIKTINTDTKYFTLKKNPYGDGTTCKHICKLMIREFDY
jgi:UDP-N-acetylglucosamine 2-epimerase (non-hydrolysing)